MHRLCQPPRCAPPSASGAPNVYAVTTKALRAAGYPTVEAMREVIATQFTEIELAAISNAFERDRERATRGFGQP